jgi:hypothetical protein
MHCVIDQSHSFIGLRVTKIPRLGVMVDAIHTQGESPGMPESGRRYATTHGRDETVTSERFGFACAT